MAEAGDLAETDESTSEPDLIASTLLAVDVDPIELELRQERLIADLLGLAPQPVTLGPYLLLDELGHGGMGVVYAAYDRSLDRKVALKRLHGVDDPVTRAQLIREAKAMAKLAHPNVVQIYEIDEQGERPYIVMEYVDGQNLRQWLADKPSRAEILATFRAAGHGLAAAHAEGLVHRDFKPDNVMVRRDGRVLVMDFGLARRVEPASDATTEGPSPASSLSLTWTGSRAGSPAYMAPEQLEGSELSPRSDQFSFCVALWEALTGSRPFAGDDLASLRRSIEAGTLPETPTLPGWLHRALARGLQIDPRARHPTMDALLDALAADPSHRRRKLLTAGLFGVALLGAAWLGARQHDDPNPACTGLDVALAEVWGPAQRDAIRSRLEATETIYASETADRVEAGLDTYTTDWVEARTEACAATQQGTQSGELLDLRMACLDDRLAHLQVTTELLVELDADHLDRAVPLVQDLPALEPCADAERLRADPSRPTDEALTAAVAEIERQLRRARGLDGAGRYAEGLELAGAAVDASAELDWPPIHVRALLRRGQLEDHHGQLDAAEASYEQAYVLALEHGLTRDAAEASTALIWIVGDRLERHAEGHRWALHAGALARASDTKLASYSLEDSLGNLAEAEGDLEAAREHHERALALLPEGAELQRASSLNNLGVVEDAAGRYERARELYREALSLHEAALGHHHPLAALTLNNLGMAAYHLGEFDVAAADFERSLEIRHASLGPTHSHVATSLNNLGMVADVRGDSDQARAYYLDALETWRAAFGPDHPLTGHPLVNLGIVETTLGQLDLARGHLEQSLAVFETNHGPDHPDVALALVNLALVVDRLGEPERARQQLERALQIWDPALGSDHPNVAIVHVNLGDNLLAAGQVDEAQVHYQRALEAAEGKAGADEIVTAAKAGLEQAGLEPHEMD